MVSLKDRKPTDNKEVERCIQRNKDEVTKWERDAFTLSREMQLRKLQGYREKEPLGDHHTHYQLGQNFSASLICFSFICSKFGRCQKITMGDGEMTRGD